MISEEIRNFANSIGIDGIGWFKSCSFNEYLKSLESRISQYNFEYRSMVDFMEAGMEKKGIKTIVVIVADYFYENNYKGSGFKLSNYSRFCWNTVEPLADKIINYIKGLGFSAQRINVPDRAAACIAELGFVGKNCMFYASEVGSYAGIRTIGTDLELKDSITGEEQTGSEICRKCRKCIESCPVGAIYQEGYRIDPGKCISFLNRHVEEGCRQYPQNLTNLDGWLYGCEVCQDVCPLNKGKQHKRKVVFKPEIDIYGMRLPNVAEVSVWDLENRIRDLDSECYKTYIENLKLSRKQVVDG